MTENRGTPYAEEGESLQVAEVEKKHRPTPGKSQTWPQGPVGGPMAKKLKTGGDPDQGPLGKKGDNGGNQPLRGEQTSPGMQAKGKMTRTRVRLDQVRAGHSDVIWGLQLSVPENHRSFDQEASICLPCVGVEPSVPSS